MDFHAFSRKQLQALCKKNKIPANMTNLAMANALEALQQVEGLDEILNPVDPDAQKFPDEKGVGTPDIHRTACRTSTRRKPVREEPESSKISTRLQRGTRVRNDEGIDQENKDLNVPVTPAVPNSRRRAPAVSTRRKKEDERPTDHVPKTPAASGSMVRATSAYNTRKSVRLLEKNLSKMSLMDTEETEAVKVEEISEEMTSVSQQIEDSEDTEQGTSSQATSTEVLEKTDELELTSSEKNTGFESQSNDSSSEDPEQGASSQAISTDILEKTDELEFTSSEKNNGFENQSNDSNSEVQLVSEVASDAGASLQAEPQECPVKINKSEAPFKDMNSSYEGEPRDSNSKHSVSSEKCCDESDVDLTKSIGKEVDEANNEAGTGILCQPENFCHSSEPENKISPCAKNYAISVDTQKENEHSKVGNVQNSELMLCSESKTVVKMDNSAEMYVSKGNTEDDASVVVAGNKNKENEHSNVGNDIENSENKEAVEFYVLKSDAENDASVMVAEDKHKENECFDVADDYIQNSEQMSCAEDKAIEMAYGIQNSEEMFCAEDKAVEMAYGIQNSEEMFYAEDKAVEMEDSTSPLIVVREELEAKVGVSSDIEESKEYEGKDADTQVCIEPSPEGNMNVLSVTGSHSSLVRNEAEAEPEAKDVQIDNEECKENAAAAEETLDAATMNCAPISNKQKTSDVPIKFPCQAQSVLKDNAVEDQTVRKMGNQEDDKQKENLNNDDLTKKSMRELKKMLKNLSLDGKTNNKTSNSVKEVERKRTALQALPENQMTASNGQPLLP